MKKNAGPSSGGRLKLQNIPEPRACAAGVGGTASARRVCGFDFVRGHIASGLHCDAQGFATDAQLVNTGACVLVPDALDLSVWPVSGFGRVGSGLCRWRVAGGGGRRRCRWQLSAHWKGEKNHQGGQQEGSGGVLHISL